MVTIDGIDNVIEMFEKIADANEMETIIGKGCAIVERAAKQKAPKDTGELIRSIKSKVEGNSNNIVGTIYSPLEYAPYVEYGTGFHAEKGGRTDIPWKYKDDKGEWHTTIGQKPHPFLRPAFNENKEKIMRMIKEGLVND